MSDEQYGGAANPIPLTRPATPAQAPTAGVAPSEKYPSWSFQQERRAQYIGLVTKLSSALVMHGGPNLPSSTLVSKTFEYANAVDAELQRQLQGRW